MRLENYISEFLGRKMPNTKDVRAYHPSQITTNCDRKMFYTKTAKEFKFSGKTLENFEKGKFIHTWMEEFLRWLEIDKKAIKIISIEQPRQLAFMDKEWWFDMQLDSKVIELDSRKMFIYDFKSIESLKRYDRENNLVDVELPKPEHVVQLQLYMMAHKVKNGKIIYVEKKTFFQKFIKGKFEMKEFEIKLDRKMITEKIAQIDKVNAYINRKELPDRISKTMLHWECRYCDWFDKCKDNNNPFENQREVE